ncbi:MAG TPA: ATP-binding protein [Steroidobacteraceae bacterium]|jgi:two-component system chemotaxis sensor kinase CheA|nr:ATP-binding protein [Steroidobacteraceae bacterium]
MSDTAQQPQMIIPALQSELDSLRDQRDLYRSLLLCEPEPLAEFICVALETVETLRSTLRMPTRDSGAFRGKIERLQMELMSMEQALTGMHLPTVSLRLQTAVAAVNEIGLRAEITGNDLLPAMVLLEELCSHVLIASNAAAVHVPIADEDEQEEELEASERRAQRKLGVALRQMCDKLSAEHGKKMSLVTIGFEEMPGDWSSVLFDLLGQLLRNSIEYGIEPADARLAAGKPDVGTMAIEFVDRGTQGFELNVQDDGAGLDTDRITDVAVRLGLLPPDCVRGLDPGRLLNLIFQPGVTTSQDPARRGLGMQIVREHVQRLGGKMQIAAKRGQYLRFQISLPPLTESD